jgi:hypothetical protein
VIGGITGGVGSAFSGAGIATQVAVGAGIGAGGSAAQQEVFTGHVDWGQVALSTGVGGVGAGAGSMLSKLAAARSVNAGEVGDLKPPTSGVSVASTGPHSPDFVVHPNGDVVPVPKGAVGPSPVVSGRGFQFEGGSGGHGLDPRVTDVRIMNPVMDGKYRYPNGYVSYSNAFGQAVDPYTGQTVPKSSPWWHWKF